MMEENQVANISEESTLEETDETSDSSTEETQDSEATEEQATEEQTPLHEHPRFKEVIGEKNELKEQVQALQNKLLEVTDRVTTNQQSKEDPYADLDQQSKAWLKQRDAQVEEIARRVATEERKKAEVEMQAVRNEYGKLAAQQFLDKHEDVKRGSEELTKIVEKAKAIGGNLEDAYKVVMFDKNVEKAVQGATKKRQEKIKEKIKANVETEGVGEGLKSQDKISFDDSFAKAEKDLNISY